MANLDPTLYKKTQVWRYFERALSIRWNGDEDGDGACGVETPPASDARWMPVQSSTVPPQHSSRVLLLLLFGWCKNSLWKINVWPRFIEKEPRLLDWVQLQLQWMWNTKINPHQVTWCLSCGSIRIIMISSGVCGSINSSLSNNVEGADIYKF